MGKGIRLIAIDLDDTLLTGELAIPPRCRETIARAMSQGAMVCVATGRMFCSALPFARELGLNGPVIAYNGALVRTPGGDTVYHQPVPLPVAQEVVMVARENRLSLNVYLDDTLYVEEVTEHTRYYLSHSGVEAHPVGNMMRFLDRDPTKVLVVDQKERVAGFIPILWERFQGRLEVVGSKPRYIEMTSPGVSKGRALLRLAASLGVETGEVMAIGDSFNDLDMIESAGIGVAVANAPYAVQSRADWVAPSNEEGGVAAAIERFVLAGTTSPVTSSPELKSEVSRTQRTVP
ncbi:MAG: HAD family phosphatase [Firmicutes bacterium]|nr:HAD family phosphatase [Bacillota bacterium]